MNNYEIYLKKEKIISDSEISIIKKEIRDQINSAWKIADEEEGIVSDTQTELKDVFRDYTFSNILKSNEKTEKRLVDAVSDGLRLSVKT